MTITIPVRVVSEANQREHWAVKYKRKKSQQAAVAFLFARHRRVLRGLRKPVTVSLLRLAPRGTMDPDNLAGSFKHVIDEIARVLDVNDGDQKAVRWSYAQERGAEFGVRVVIEGSGK